LQHFLAVASKGKPCSAEDEMGSKKIVPHKARSKSGLNAPPRRQPSPSPPSSPSQSSSPSESGEDDSDDDEEQGSDDGDGSGEEDAEEEEEEESSDEGLEYNPRTLVSPINTLGLPTDRKQWGKDHVRDFHDACELK
jgi:Mg-chelatase subunit ChlI